MNMSGVLVPALTLLLSGGCSSTYEFSRDGGSAEAEKALSDMVDEDITLTLQYGKEYEGTLLRWTKDSLLFTRRDSGETFSVPVGQVYSVTTAERLPGAIGGLVVGGTIGWYLAQEKEGYLYQDAVILYSTAIGAGLGAIAGGLALPTTRTVTFATTLLEDPALQQVVAVLVPALLEDSDEFISFRYSDRTIRLRKGEVTIERQTDGVLVKATRRVFQSAGFNP